MKSILSQYNTEDINVALRLAATSKNQKVAILPPNHVSNFNIAMHYLT